MLGTSSRRVEDTRSQSRRGRTRKEKRIGDKHHTNSVGASPDELVLPGHR